MVGFAGSFVQMYLCFQWVHWHACKSFWKSRVKNATVLVLKKAALCFLYDVIYKSKVYNWVAFFFFFYQQDNWGIHILFSLSFSSFPLSHRIPLKKFRSIRRQLTDSGKRAEDLLAGTHSLKYNFGFPSSNGPTPETLKNYLDVRTPAPSNQWPLHGILHS